MTDATGVDERRGAGPVPPGLRAAAALVLIEAAALLGACVVLLVKTVSGHPGDRFAALSITALALVGAAVLGFGARGLLRLRPAARTPVVLLQLLALPVAYSLWFQAGRPGYGAPILVAALATLYLLFTPASRQALDREV